VELFDTPFEPSHLQRNSGDFAEVRRIAGSGSDYPVLMLNMNRYTRDSGSLHPRCHSASGLNADRRDKPLK
jgi:hypothetical protein